MKLGTAIKLVRTSSGLTQRGVANDLGVTSNYISLIEGGKREPSVSFLKKLAVLFKVPVSLFFLWDDTDPSALKSNVVQMRDLLTQLEAMYVLTKRQRNRKSKVA